MASSGDGPGRGTAGPWSIQVERRAGRAATLAIVAVMVVALVAALTALDASSASANQLGRASARLAGQGYYESVMLQADRLVARLDRGRDAVRRDLRRAARHLSIVAHVVRTLGRPSGCGLHRYGGSKQCAQGWRGRAQGLPAADAPSAVATRQRASEGPAAGKATMGRALRKTAVKRHRMNALRRSLGAAIGRRESAEAALGGMIVSATRLAQQRAGAQDGRQPRDRGHASPGPPLAA